MRFQTTFKKTVLTFLAIGILIGLGAWQLRRAEWKNQLIATIQANQNAAPLPRLPDDGNDGALEYRRVVLTGLVDDSKVIFLGPRTLNDRSGYYMIVPMSLPDKRTVLVNQGFIENAYVNDIRPTHPVIQSVTGTLRRPAVPGLFTPKNPADGNRYYWLDLPTIGQRLNMNVLPVYVELDASAARYSVDNNAYLSIPNNHLQYALTWLTLAVIAAIFYLISSFRRQATIEPGFRRQNPNIEQGMTFGPGRQQQREQPGKPDDDTPTLWS